MVLKQHSHLFIWLISLLPTLALADPVVVYLLDNGVRMDHEAFKGRHLESVDFVEGKWLGPEASNLQKSGYGDHATLLAGLIMERAPQVKLISVRTLNKAGKGSWSQFLQGVYWITNHHPAGAPAVANLSLGGVPDSPIISELVTQAIDTLVADGVTVVVAAGNEGKDEPGRIPSTLESVIAVGAVSLFHFRLRDSNYGSCVDLYAPGEKLKGPGSKRPNIRIRNSGTSAAAAVVTGRVADYLADHPSSTPSEVKAWLLGISERGKVKNLPGNLAETSLLLGEK